MGAVYCTVGDMKKLLRVVGVAVEKKEGNRVGRVKGMKGDEEKGMRRRAAMRCDEGREEKEEEEEEVKKIKNGILFVCSRIGHYL
jgi:hypothetical protein